MTHPQVREESVQVASHLSPPLAKVAPACLHKLSKLVPVAMRLQVRAASDLKTLTPIPSLPQTFTLSANLNISSPGTSLAAKQPVSGNGH